ncbi:MAG: hypothetical protein Q8M86_07375 [Syntrophales bacterium]|nr:hypothetical protein [Syntrophales bacterium]MDP3097751.1 hypothetical protein [Syntrophales bacterium]
MKMEMNPANVVIIARQFNPSIISQYWLIKNGIFTEEEIHPDSIFTPVIANVRSKDCQVLVLPEQLQFTSTLADPAAQELLISKLGKIVQTLPHTPFVAVGLNFSWQVYDEVDSSSAALGRKLFFRDDSPLYKFFDADDARFGSYMSRDILGCRLKLDIKPVTVPCPEGTSNRLLFGFNFHLQLIEDDKAESILNLFQKWDEAKETAFSLMKQIA